MCKNITGRDGFIMARALAMAIAVVPELPEVLQATRDRDDMLKLLRAFSPGTADMELNRAAETMSHLADRYRSA
jgi:hypothetical protein